jgi:uncharacterized protein YyaL (SSP411 family)
VDLLTGIAELVAYPVYQVHYDDEEDTGLIPLLADRPSRDGRATAYVCEGCACQNPATGPERLARQLGIS